MRKRGLALRSSHVSGEAVGPALWVTEEGGCEIKMLLTS